MRAGVERELVTEPGGERIDERESARIPSIGLGYQCADDVSDLGLRYPVRPLQFYGIVARLGRDEAIEVDRVDRHPHVVERAIEADGDEIAGGTDPGAAAAEDDASKAGWLFDFERERPVVEIHRHVVMHPDEVVDAGDVVAPGLQSEAGPIERLGGDDRWNVAARLDVAQSPGAARGIQLDKLWLHVSRSPVGYIMKTPTTRILF